MKFAYDKNKSATNKAKHDISLEEAKELWQVPSVEVEARTIDEPRFMVIGKLNGKFYSCIYTLRGNAIRLISARRSRKTEEEIYHEIIKT
ncbi:MAG: hypothetical protein A3E85_04580 [Gammaproteobacteria bacterium RIFCSPHIGHO2_12_FULL_45_12]|nr:MAG: hypothetical protein A3E85_04580 [Gammaproteobacteria bacterium RIFCSPHIGHO2_12_FULL_45_12]